MTVPPGTAAVPARDAATIMLVRDGPGASAARGGTTGWAISATVTALASGLGLGKVSVLGSGSDLDWATGAA